MFATETYKDFVTSRARAELKPYQSNIDVRTVDGSLLRAQWNTVAFTDFESRDEIVDVVDFWVDHRLPEGGFYPHQDGPKL